MTQKRRVPRIGVLIVDHHRMFAEALAHLLDAEADLAVLGVATTAHEGLARTRMLQPDVVITGEMWLNPDGSDIVDELKQLSAGAHVVMVTGNVGAHLLLRAIEAGCSGFVPKDRPASDVAPAVRAAAAGEAAISPAEMTRLLRMVDRKHHELGDDLVPGERRVLKLMALGLSNADIAAEVHLSVNTVRNYVTAILQKLDAHSKLQAVIIAVREGLVEPPS